MKIKQFFIVVGIALIFAFVFVFGFFIFNKIFIGQDFGYIDSAIGAFMGAFFAFLFIRLGDAFNALYQRQIKHHNALVKLELYLHDTMYLMEHNEFVANDYKNTFKEAKSLKKVIVNPHQFSVFPLAEELQLELFGKEILNMLFSFTFRLKGINADLKSTIDFYSDLKQTCISSKDVATYLENIKMVEERSEVIKAYFIALRKDGIKLICETRVQLKRKTIMTSIMFVIMRIEYKPATDVELTEERKTLLDDQRILQEESKERMSDLQEKIKEIQKTYERD